MPLWDNSTVYIGRAKRQACIAEIAKALTNNYYLAFRQYNIEN